MMILPIIEERMNRIQKACLVARSSALRSQDDMTGSVSGESSPKVNLDTY
jgi:hypothetical protein